jgi:hypothetical protein
MELYWTSTTDRHPETQNYVLVQIKNEALPKIARWTVCSTDSGYGFYRWEDTTGSALEDVEAWMELPERHVEKIRLRDLKSLAAVNTLPDNTTIVVSVDGLDTECTEMKVLNGELYLFGDSER